MFPRAVEGKPLGLLFFVFWSVVCGVGKSVLSAVLGAKNRKFWRCCNLL